MKPVYELTIEDIKNDPIWEFVSDETIENIDESFVQISPDNKILSKDKIYVVRAEFHLPSGDVLTGYVTPSETNDFGYIQPTIITQKGQVNFWCGMDKPTEITIDGNYQIIAIPKEKIFPVTFKAVIPTPGLFTKGALEGFYYSPNPDDNKIIFTK